MSDKTQKAQNPQSNKPSTHQFVICAINIETATNRKFLQAFTNKECEPLRFDSVNDCVLYLAKIGVTSAEIDAGPFKFVNFYHVLKHGDQTGRIVPRSRRRTAFRARLETPAHDPAGTQPSDPIARGGVEGAALRPEHAKRRAHLGR